MVLSVITAIEVYIHILFIFFLIYFILSTDVVRTLPTMTV